MGVVVPLFMCYFTYKLVIFMVFTHYNDYNENHLLFHHYLLDGCHSAIPFLPGLIQIFHGNLLLIIIHLSYQEAASSSYYINPCTIIWACEFVWSTLIFESRLNECNRQPSEGHPLCETN